MRRILFLFFTPVVLSAVGLGQSRRATEEGGHEGPWFTGPLLTASAYTIPKGHFNIEPYVFFSHDFGAYGANGNFHSESNLAEAILSIEIIQMGLTDRIDLTLYPQFIYSYTEDTNHLAMGDITIGTSFQLIREDPRYYGLTAKIGLEQVFPSARYDNLDPQLIGVQGIGGGGYTTSLYLAVHRAFHVYNDHYFAIRAAARGVFFTPFYIHNHSVYGGGEETRGKIARGASMIFSVALEYSLSRHWALALDIQNTYTTGSTFTGTSTVDVGNPKAAYLLTFAPAVEYNFTKNIGMIAGVWVSAAGINTESFVSFVLALNMYI